MSTFVALLTFSHTDVENPKALTAYFKLIQAIVRILASIVLSRGAQNDHTISEARLFLQEHRMNIMAIFKRSANIGMLGDKSRITEENGSLIQELVDNLTILISSSDFLAVGPIYLAFPRLGADIFIR